jgi:hypothetical protein
MAGLSCIDCRRDDVGTASGGQATFNIMVASEPVVSRMLRCYAFGHVKPDPVNVDQKETSRAPQAYCRGAVPNPPPPHAA